MKSIKLVLVGVISLFGSYAAQADMPEPGILASVSSDSVVPLTEIESSETRGEYRACGKTTGRCITTWSRSEPFSNRYINVVWKYKFPGTSFWVSR
jgi:hypothetical protein